MCTALANDIKPLGPPSDFEVDDPPSRFVFPASVVSLCSLKDVYPVVWQAVLLTFERIEHLVQLPTQIADFLVKHPRDGVYGTLPLLEGGIGRICWWLNGLPA